MVQYFMHLRGGTDEVLDAEGAEFPGLAALREAVLVTARDVLATDVRRGVMDLSLRIDAEDESGLIVHTLPLEQAVTTREGAGCR